MTRFIGLAFVCGTAILTVACAATLESRPHIESSRIQPSTEHLGSEPIDLTTSLEQALAAGPSIEAACSPTVCEKPSRHALFSQTFQEIQLKTDVPVRAPIRQTWFHPAKLTPIGDDVEFDLPESELLAHRGAGSLGNFRNP
jgi:hypothetical protein